MDLTAFNELIASLVGEQDSQLSPGDVSRAAGLVINRYSVDVPRQVTEDLEVLSGGVLSAPAAWQSGLSKVRSVEFPIGEKPPVTLPQEYFYVYDAIDQQTVVFTAGPVAGDDVRLVYTGRHNGPETIALEDRELCAALAAAQLCDQLAARYGHSTAPTIQADSVNHNDKGRFFAGRARDLRARYENKFGAPTALAAASSVVTVERSSSDGRRRMFH